MGRASLSVIQDLTDGLVAERPVQWAISELLETAATKGLLVHRREQLELIGPNDLTIVVTNAAASIAQKALQESGVTFPHAPESLALLRANAGGKDVLVVCGKDILGLVYGVLELADRIRHTSKPIRSLQAIDKIVEQPANEIRSIARPFESEAEDKAWYYDKSFWTRYLTHLVAQRFNRFSLTLGLGYNFAVDVHDAYFYFAYPFLVSVPGYDVRAPGLSDTERDRNLEALKFISKAASERGLHFQLGLWTHTYQWKNSPNANYVIEGLNDDSHPAYCRDALQMILEECPEIKGVTFRVHGESGIQEGSHGFWKTVFDGVVRSGRRVEIDMHSKGIDEETIDVALRTGVPVVVSPKYHAEHMGLPYHQASIRELERQMRRGRGEHAKLMALSGGSRRFTRYGNADLLTEDRRYGILYRIWPGTQTFLLWGDPVLASGYGRYSHFCGTQGVEICEPLSFKGRMGSGTPGGHDPYANPDLHLGVNAWEKYRYTYRVWGRLLYNPEAAPEQWRRQLVSEFGEAADACGEALANASRILPLVTTAYHPSASNNSYWPELYTNMPIVLETDPPAYRDTPEPYTFRTVTSLDPVLFSSAEEFVDELVRGERSGKYTLIDVANWLDGFAEVAETRIAEAKEKVKDAADPSFRRWAIDIAALAGLGRFFARKFRAGVAYTAYEKAGDVSVLQSALQAYRGARDAWQGIVDITKEVYRENIAFGLTPRLSGHWQDRLQDIEKDLHAMEAKLSEATSDFFSDSDQETIAAALESLQSRSSGVSDSESAWTHTPPAAFRSGDAVPIQLTLNNGSGDSDFKSARVTLHYRHVDQRHLYKTVEMTLDGDTFRTTIPGEYSDSRYPLMYFFEIKTDTQAWMYPRLNDTLSNQPYYVVRQAEV